MYPPRIAAMIEAAKAERAAAAAKTRTYEQPPRCVHLGQPVRSPSYCTDPRVMWYRCDLPTAKRVSLHIAPVVSSCHGCNTKCAGFEDEGQE